MTQRLAAVCATVMLAAPAFGQAPATVPAPTCSSCAGNSVPAATCSSCAGDPAPAACSCLDQPAPCVPCTWVTAEYLFAWIPGDHVRPLITTSPAGTPRTEAGVLGAPGTAPLFGQGSVNGGMRSGLRFGAGYWFDQDRTFGVEAGTMILESQARGVALSSTGNPILARPIFNADTQAFDSVIVAYPGVASGSVAAQVRSGNFYEAHLDLAQNYVEKGWFRLDALVGYRFFRFNEGLSVQEVSAPTGAGIVPGTQISAFDNFGATNEFNGGDFGFRATFRRNNLSADFVTRLAVGMLQRHVNIGGETTTSVPGSAPVTGTGGVLALTSNIGSYSLHYATLFPEFGLNLAWQATSHVKLRAGYSLLLLDRIARAADQPELRVNPTLFPTSLQPMTGPEAPQFHLRTAELWMQALSLGMEFTF